DSHIVEIEPHNVEEALLSENWKKAMQEEYNALMKNKKWNLVLPKQGIKVFKNKWVYRLKCDLEGKMQRYKARLVVKGFLQTLGVDFGKIYSPVIKASTLKIILTLAMCREWKIRQVDVNNAFLNCKLEETVYMN
ncbi:uncharacterized protein LOC111382376, partial [Olea europaea var. sylvestris]|uniref:uncharacterized protein LOC111382376 n=1 Tax=Olea europaea var. sylvestris TaxID=158386 RepID=UPI000C1D2D74